MDDVPDVPWGKMAAVAGALLASRLIITGVSALVSMASHEAATGSAAATCPGGAEPVVSSDVPVSPRRVVRCGFLLMFVGIVALVASLDVGVGPEVVTWPLLIAGLGIGALASQLGSVTVSAVPDEQSAEVGGLQNSVTFLGASVGTALAGTVLVSALSSSFFAGIQGNEAVPEELSSRASVELAGGIPFIPDDQLEEALAEAGVTGDVAEAVTKENEVARLDGLRSALAVLAVLALVALLLTGALPTRQPGDREPDDAEDTGDAKPH